MLAIETKKLVISEELKRKVDIIYKFASSKPIYFNGSIRSIKGTNIAYVCNKKMQKDFKNHFITSDNINDFILYDFSY